MAIETKAANFSDSEQVLDLLIIRYPRLFQGKSPPCISPIPNGWADLIGALCGEIDGVLKDFENYAFEVRQIKEKYGTLRFYFRAPEALRDRIRVLVDAAYNKSKITCEQCGDVGVLGTSVRGIGVSTLCVGCRCGKN